MSECKCDLRTKLVGDGCRYCNPQEYIDHLIECLEEQRTWVGLTDDEIILIVAECASSHQHTDIHFARAIEQAHGIIAPTELKGEA